MLIVDSLIYASILVKNKSYEKARRFLEQHRKSELARSPRSRPINSGGPAVPLQEMILL